MPAEMQTVFMIISFCWVILGEGKELPTDYWKDPAGLVGKVALPVVLKY